MEKRVGIKNLIEHTESPEYQKAVGGLYQAIQERFGDRISLVGDLYKGHSLFSGSNIDYAICIELRTSQRDKKGDSYSLSVFQITEVLDGSIEITRISKRFHNKVPSGEYFIAYKSLGVLDEDGIELVEHTRVGDSSPNLRELEAAVINLDSWQKLERKSYPL